MKGLYCVASFITGAAVGLLASKKYFETKYEAIFEEELQSIKESRIGMSHIQDKDSINDEDFRETVNEELSNPDSVFHSSIDNMFETTSEAVAQSEEVKEEIEEIIEKEHPVVEKDTNDEPYEISEEAYSETELGFDKITLHFFTEDDILVNAETNEVQIGRTIGDEGINKIRLTDESSTYFRDPLYGCDYEVIKVIGSFYTE